MELHNIDAYVHTQLYKLASSGLCSGVDGQMMMRGEREVVIYSHHFGSLSPDKYSVSWSGPPFREMRATNGLRTKKTKSSRVLNAVQSL